MQKINTKAAEATHQKPKHILQSDIVSFFTPATEGLNYSQNVTVYRPRRDIVEGTKSQTKTVIVTNGIGSSEDPQDIKVFVDQTDNCLNGSTIIHLKSPNNMANGGVLVNDDQPSISSNLPLNLNSPFNSNDYYNSTRSIKRPPRTQKSFLSSFIRRFSTPRKVGNQESAQPRVPSVDTSIVNDHTPKSENLGSHRIKRWFSKRMWRPLKSSEIDRESQPSLASAGAVLETKPPEIESAEFIPQFAEQSPDFGSVPVHRKHLFLSGREGPVSSVSRQMFFENKSSTTDAKYTVYYSTSSSPPKTIQSAHMSSIPSFLTNESQSDLVIRPSIERDHSIRSVDRNANCSAQRLKAQPICSLTSEAPISSLSEARLPQSLVQQPRLTPLSPSDYTPSYLGISVAAFGYTGYGRTSKSAHNLVSSESPTLSNSQSKSEKTHNSTNPNSNKGHNDSLPQSGPLIASKETLGSSGQPNSLIGIPSTNRVVNKSDEKPIMCTQKHVHIRHTESVTRPQTEDSHDIIGNDIKLRRKRTTSHNGGADDQQHWQRSSLIMFAVAHASPRGRSNTPTIQEIQLNKNNTNTISGGDESLCTSEITIESPDSDLSQKIKQNDQGLFLDSVHDSRRDCIAEPAELQNLDGYSFLKQVDQTEAQLSIRILETEKDLQDCTINEEVSGLLRSACGKAKLLISEKFKQFRGLCQQNLAWELHRNRQDSSSQSFEKELVTLVSDLEGFWAMVSLQIEDVNRLFDEVDTLRQNNWIAVREKEVEKSATSNICFTTNGLNAKSVGNNTRVKSPCSKAVTQTNGSSHKKKKIEDARAQARERLALIKQEMRARQQQEYGSNLANGNDQHGSGDIIIFV